MVKIGFLVSAIVLLVALGNYSPMAADITCVTLVILSILWVVAPIFKGLREE